VLPFDFAQVMLVSCGGVLLVVLSMEEQLFSEEQHLILLRSNILSRKCRL
jgi:coenzyme F420-reducing hydrogenase gamma subunit